MNAVELCTIFYTNYGLTGNTVIEWISMLYLVVRLVFGLFGDWIILRSSHSQQEPTMTTTRTQVLTATGPALYHWPIPLFQLWCNSQSDWLSAQDLVLGNLSLSLVFPSLNRGSSLWAERGEFTLGRTGGVHSGPNRGSSLWAKPGEFALGRTRLVRLALKFHHQESYKLSIFVAKFDGYKVHG